jgi:hypothetical protein
MMRMALVLSYPCMSSESVIPVQKTVQCMNNSWRSCIYVTAFFLLCSFTCTCNLTYKFSGTSSYCWLINWIENNWKTGHQVSNVIGPVMLTNDVSWRDSSKKRTNSVIQISLYTAQPLTTISWLVTVTCRYIAVCR